MNLWGTLKDRWSIGRGASDPMIKNNGGVLEVKRTDDASLSVLRCANPSGATDAATKYYVDGLWSSNVHYLTTAAEIIAAFADETPGYHDYVVAPGNYTFTSNLVVKPDRTAKFLYGANFLMNNNSKFTTNKVANVDYHYQNYDQQCQVYYSTGVITGKFASGAAGFDWSAIAAVSGAKLLVAGRWFDVEKYTTNTITPPAGQIMPWGGNTPTDANLAYRTCSLIVPCSNVKMEGSLSIAGGAGHDGLLVDMTALFNSDMKNLKIWLYPQAAATKAIVFFQHCGFSDLPQTILENQSIQWTGINYVSVFTASFSHGINYSPIIRNVQGDVYYDGTTTARGLEMNSSSASTFGVDGVISGLRVHNSFAGRSNTTYGVQAIDTDTIALCGLYGGVGAAGNITQDSGNATLYSGGSVVNQLH